MARHHASTKIARPGVRTGELTAPVAPDLETAFAALRKASIAGSEIERALLMVPAHRRPALIFTYTRRGADRSVVRRLFEIADLEALVNYAGVDAVREIAQRFRLTRD